LEQHYQQQEYREEELEQDSDPYSIFEFGIRSDTTKYYYLRRLRIFFDHIHLLPDKNIRERCNYFVRNGKENSDWALKNIIKFLQFQKERVSRGEITSGTLKNYLKAIKLLCDSAEFSITWKKITRGLPKVRRYANDRAPTIEEIQRISEYPDRRMKAIVYTMASSGIRIGAWDYLRWGHIKPIKIGENTLAKMIVYAGDEEEYITFISPEAYSELKKWMDYRKNAGEEINEKSWVMRQLWNAKKGRKFGLVTVPKKLKSIGIKHLMEDALWTQDIRKKSQINGNRYEFQSNHGFRKWFKTQCELAGMRSINIEILMGHSIGISDSYYRIKEEELLEDYTKAINSLSVNSANVELVRTVENNSVEKDDAFIALSDQVMKLMEEVKQLKMSNSQ
jgi:hypothetical protein